MKQGRQKNKGKKDQSKKTKSNLKKCAGQKSWKNIIKGKMTETENKRRK